MTNKPQLYAHEAAAQYLIMASDAVDRSFEPWLKEVIQAMGAEGISADEITKLFNSNPIKDYYYCAVVALDCLALINGFDVVTASAVLSHMNAVLSHVDKELESQGRLRCVDRGQIIFKMLKYIKKYADEGINMPNDSAAFFLMKIMGFDTILSTSRLFDNPIFVTRISVPLLVPIVGQWKEIGGAYEIIV